MVIISAEVISLHEISLINVHMYTQQVARIIALLESRTAVLQVDISTSE